MIAIGWPPSAAFSLVEPGARDPVVAARDRVERSVQAQQQHRELERLFAGRDDVAARPHARDAGFGEPDDRPSSRLDIPSRVAARNTALVTTAAFGQLRRPHAGLGHGCFS